MSNHIEPRPTTSNLFNLTNRVAVITGGSGVLCGAMAQGMAERGCRIGVLGRTESKVVARVEAICAAGGAAIPLVADVLDRAQLEAARDAVLNEWGRIDILINGAGGNMREATIGPDENFFDHTHEGLQRAFALNFDGTILPTMIFGKPMANARRGSIVNVSSMAADRAITRIAGYSAAKAAVDNFTRWLAVECAQKFGDGLRVNAIAPGFFVTEQNRQLLTHDDGSYTDRAQTIVNNTPAGRFGEAEELLGTIIWLASDASRFVTGTVIAVDGGFSAWSGV